MKLYSKKCKLFFEIFIDFWIFLVVQILMVASFSSLWLQHSGLMVRIHVWLLVMNTKFTITSVMQVPFEWHVILTGEVSPLLWLHKKSHLSQEKNYWSEMVWYFIDVYIINRTLHGRLEIRNFSSHVETIFHSFAALTREIFCTQREICISTQPCNILYLLLTWINKLLRH